MLRVFSGCIKRLIKENEREFPKMIVAMVIKNNNPDSRKVKGLLNKHMGG